MNLKVATSTFIETGCNLGIYLSMKLLLTWILEFVLRTSQCFMHLHHVILSNVVAETRRQLGIHGKFILNLSRVSIIAN